MSKFSQSLLAKIKAGYQAFSLRTLEPRRVRTELARFGRDNDIPVFIWEAPFGFSALWLPDEDARAAKQAAFFLNRVDAKDDLADAFSAIVDEEAVRGGDSPPRALFVIADAHSSFQDYPSVRTRFVSLVAQSFFSWQVPTEGDRPAGGLEHPVIFAQAVPGLHPELEHLVEPLELPLWTRDEIAEYGIDHVALSLPEGATGLEGPEGARLREQIADACLGLYAHQIVDILSEAAIDGGLKFTKEALPLIRKSRTAAINASGFLKVYDGPETFADIGGLDAVKDYTKEIMAKREKRTIAKARGVVLVGLPGTGKSLLAKALGNETGRLTLELDTAAIMQGEVGASERNMLKALAIVDAAGPAVLFIDEIEKALAGLESSGKSDAGTMARVFATLLKWLSNHESDVFTIVTANGIDGLPPELTRAGRFNNTFFLDLPDYSSRQAMWRQYIARHGLEARQPIPPDEGWTGAEISSCCADAELRGRSLVEAAQDIVPLTISYGEQLDRLRAWADGRFADATLGGRYRKNVDVAAASGKTPGGQGKNRSLRAGN